MKRILLILSVVVLSLNVMGQTTKVKTNKHEQRIDSLITRIDSLIDYNNAVTEHIEMDLALKQRYKLYRTENVYTLLKLDTKTGMIDQVQWSLEDDKEFTVGINYINLNDDGGDGFGSGTYELYPTKNMYQFLLLNKVTGETWHVQWGMEYSKRWIQKIN